MLGSTRAPKDSVLGVLEVVAFEGGGVEKAVTEGKGEALVVAAAAAGDGSRKMAFFADTFRGFFSAGSVMSGVTNAAVCRFRERVTVAAADLAGERGLDKEGAMMVHVS